MFATCPTCGAANLEGADECAQCGADLRTVGLPAAKSPVETSIMQLPLTALQLTPVHAVTPDTTLDVAVQTLCRQKVDMLEVVEDGRLIGLISVRDIMNRVGPDYRNKLSLPVSQFMTRNPETLARDVPIAFGLNKMDVGGYRHVPVVQDERLVGVASVRDMIRYLVKHMEQTGSGSKAPPDLDAGPPGAFAE